MTGGLNMYARTAILSRHCNMIRAKWFGFALFLVEIYRNIRWYCQSSIKSLCHNDTIQRRRSRWTLTQVTASILTVLSTYPNQYWFVFSEVLFNSHKNTCAVSAQLLCTMNLKIIYFLNYHQSFMSWYLKTIFYFLRATYQSLQTINLCVQNTIGRS